MGPCRAGWLTAFLICTLFLTSLSGQTLDTFGDWRTGRATFYGTDAWWAVGRVAKVLSGRSCRLRVLTLPLAYTLVLATPD
jgi:hypothetical protein